MKTCYTCKLVKLEKEFRQCAKKRDGLDHNCKTCAREFDRQRYVRDKDHRNAMNKIIRQRDKDKIYKRSREYSFTLRGRISSMYTALKSRCKFHPSYIRFGLPSFTLKEFRKFIYSQPNYIKLHTNWINSGRSPMLAPSIDRIDSTNGYSLDNIQLITWRENILKGVHDRARRKAFEKQFNHLKGEHNV